MSPEINCSSLCAHLAVQTSFLTFKSLKINSGSLFSLLINANYTLLKHCYQSSPVIGVCVHWLSVSACCTGIIISLVETEQWSDTTLFIQIALSGLEMCHLCLELPIRCSRVVLTDWLASQPSNCLSTSNLKPGFKGTYSHFWTEVGSETNGDSGVERLI